MTVSFDPDAGVLRMSHAALSVLARLATDPNHPDLVDHAVAPPLSALRRAGVVGPAGIHPDVQSLATAIGAHSARLDLELTDRTGTANGPGWVSPTLIVMAVPVGEAEDSYDLVADVPAAGADLIGELVGLPAVADTEGERLLVAAGAFRELLSGRSPGLAPGGANDEDTHAAVERLVSGLQAHWRLTVRRAGAPPQSFEILDAGGAGLWSLVVGGGGGSGDGGGSGSASGHEDALELVAVSAVQVRERLRALLAPDPW